MSLSAFTAWLGLNVVSPEAFSRLISSMASGGAEYRRLAASVHRDTNIKPGRAYQRWLQTPDIWESLITDAKSGYPLLVQALERELARKLILPWKRESTDQRKRDAEAMVNSTLVNLIASLETSRAVAVTERRIRDDLRDMRGLISVVADFQSNIAQYLPPLAAEVLRELNTTRPDLASKLFEAVTASSSPPDALQGLASRPPSWLGEAPAVAWLFLAEMASAHDRNMLAADMYERVADLGLDRAKHVTLAAVNRHSADISRAQQEIDSARDMGGWWPEVEIIAAALEEDDARIFALSQEPDSLDVRVLTIVSEARWRLGDRGGAMEIFRRAIARHPNYAEIRIRLARQLMLLLRSPSPGNASAIRLEIGSLVLEARDLRRKWRGNSSEAVEMACALALEGGDWDTVLKLGRESPEGEATSEEAAWPAVKRLVVEAAMADGRFDVASQIIDETEDLFARTLLRAELAERTGSDIDAIQRKYAEAWRSVRDDEDRIQVWQELARLGVELPEREMLESRDDERSAVILATSEFARGDEESAITRLRGWRNRSPAAAFHLGRIYANLHREADATAVFSAAATRFDDPRFLAMAAESSARDERFDEADRFAADALLRVVDDVSLRERLHEILIEIAQRQGLWRQTEERVRTLIAELGPNQSRRWMLTGALFNQRRWEAAWDSLRVAPALEPSNKDHAVAWIVLGGRFRTDPEFARDLLRAIDKFPTSVDVTAAAISTYAIWSAGDVELPAEVVVEWQERIARFVKDNPGHPAFQAMTIPQGHDELTRFLRDLLEPEARQFHELQQQVQDFRIPYGMLSTLTNRPYCTALASRAAGCLPICILDSGTMQEEVRCAVGAFNDTVVVDLSAVAVAAYVRSDWLQMILAFARVLLPSPARADLVHALDDYRIRPTGIIGWDLDADLPRLTESNEARDEVEQQLRWMAKAVEDFDTIDWPHVKTYAQAFEAHDATERGSLPWLASLDCALHDGLTLYSDDPVLRAAARSAGRGAFGTVALFNACLQEGKIGESALSRALDELRKRYCVDLPIELSDLIRLGGESNWAPGPMAFVLTRGPIWRDLGAGARTWLALCAEITKSNNSQLPYWLHAAITGVRRHYPMDTTRTVAYTLLGAATLASRDHVELFTQLLSAARGASRLDQEQDVLVPAVRQMLEILVPAVGEETAAREVLRITELTGQADRDTIRRVVFLDKG